MTMFRIEGDELVITKGLIELRIEPRELKDEDAFNIAAWASEHFF